MHSEERETRMDAAMTAIDDNTRMIIRKHQLGEITEHHIYLQLAARQRDAGNRAVLERIAADEKRHAGLWPR